jgi:hypothetical protein
MEAEPLDEYREQVKQGVFSSLPYDRLMIHYRKQKEYEEELKVIKKAIDTFKNFYAKLQATAIKKQKSKVAELSRKFSRQAGLTDKKGNDTYLPEPLPRWIKRQAAVEQKMRKGKK